MRKMVTALLTAGMLGLAGGAALADPVAGLWKTQANEEGGYLHVNVSPCGAAMCGTIKAAFNAKGTQSSDYEHLGKRIIWDMGAAGNGKYADGRIWAPDTDKTYRSRMELAGSNLKVSGCIGPICRGQTWTRVN